MALVEGAAVTNRLQTLKQEADMFPMADDREEAVKAARLGSDRFGDGAGTLIEVGCDTDPVATTVDEAVEVTGAIAKGTEDQPTTRPKLARRWRKGPVDTPRATPP